MKKKLLAAAIVIAGALVLPTMAAQDTSGMRYTSASEGFYASLRVQFNSGGENTDSAGSVTDNGIGIENSSSRFGVRGTNDLGDGWQGFYQYEAGVGIDNGGSLSTRLAHVGVRGGFGQLQVGTFWPASYNWVHGSTDVANWASGSFIGAMLLPSRQSRALEYTTPDLNGFQAAAFIEMDPNRDGEGALAATAPDIITATTFLSDDPVHIRDEAIAYNNAAPADRAALLSRFYIAAANLDNRGFTNVAVPQFASDFGPVTVLVGTGPAGAPVVYDINPTVVIRNERNHGITLSTAMTMVVQNGVNVFYFNTLLNRNINPLAFQDGPVHATDTNPPDVVTGNRYGEHVIFAVERDTVSITPGTPGNPKDDNDIDLWSLSAKYSFQGFDTGISYTVAPDGIEKSSGSRNDLSLYALRFGYAQDNWYVTSWYAEDNAGDDVNRDHDTETFSLAAGVEVGKANLYAVYEAQERDNYEPETATAAAVDSTGSHEDESATVGLQYNLSSRSRLWIEYASRDYESADVDNYTTIGLRHDL